MIEGQLGQNTSTCAVVNEPFKNNETRRISCVRSVIGNIVKIRQTSTEPQVLTLCEVEVFGIRCK